LSEVAKTGLAHITRNYLWQDRAEHDATFLDQSLTPLMRFSQLAGKLLKLLSDLKSLCDRAGKHDDAAKYAWSVAHQCLREKHNSDITELMVGLSNLLRNYSTARDEACAQLTETSKRSGFREGDAWRSMVSKLLDLAEEYELPHTVAKPSERTKHESKFVALVREIQLQLRKVHWKPGTSEQALAKAIYGVKKQRKQRGDLRT
jgi:hypothetical protein